jgi:sigma-B regulation protein RsbU (phosphoserine phosphatase)
LGVLFSAALGAGLFVYLRRAFNPLERSVQVLNALSRGELNASLDEGDEALQDEAGQIARGVASLRLELLSLQMLRDERLRIRRQQERLIRTQLKLLADSLDDVSRLEILQALQTDVTPVVKPVDGPDNTLADLAKILGRMSGLVTTQQGRLVALLKELRAAMEQQALLVSLQQELEIARSMQLSILPRQAPSTEAVEVDALMVPAKEVGGDFYDYFLVGDQHLALVVADVSGKGIPAAFFMAISRTLLKNNATLLAEPAHIMARLNDQLCSENEQMMFVTVFFGLLELATGKLDYVNAGHNPPALRRADGTVSLLPSGQNTALAVIDGLDYVPGQLTLANGDLLLLYTDGVTEAANARDQLFGEARMLDIVQAHQPGQPSQTSLTQAVLQQIRVFEAGAAQADDITCVSVLYKGPA